MPQEDNTPQPVQEVGTPVPVPQDEITPDARPVDAVQPPEAPAEVGETPPVDNTDPAIVAPTTEPPVDTEDDDDLDDDFGFGLQQPSADPALSAEQQQLAQQVDWTQYADADGNVSLDTFWQVMQRQQSASAQQIADNATRKALEMVASREQERKLWDKASEKYPQIKTDKTLRELVKSVRNGSIISGKDLTPAQAAAEIFDRVSSAEAQGRKAAEETVEIQDVSAHLETASAKGESSNSQLADLKDRMRSPNKKVADSARVEYLKAVFFKKD